MLRPVDLDVHPEVLPGHVEIASSTAPGPDSQIASQCRASKSGVVQVMPRVCRPSLVQRSALSWARMKLTVRPTSRTQAALWMNRGWVPASA
ncbi:MAG: hypothetical protein WA994_10760 [Ornithinimicrobium sp.]